MGRLTPQEIREHEFKQSALGFSREQVHEFLDQVAEELETLIRESNEIHAESREARMTLQTYRNVEESLKETLLLAQKTAQEAIQRAQAEADTILRKASTEKDALLFSAKEDLHEVQTEIRELDKLRSEMLTKLKSILRSNLDVLDEAYSRTESTIGAGSVLNELGDERIIDFSQTDLVVEDLEDGDEPDELDQPDQLDEPDEPEIQGLDSIDYSKL